MIKQLLLLMLPLLLLVACDTTHQDYTSQLKGAVFSPPTAIEDFTFQSTTGEPFILSEHKGKVVLLFFGYLTCPDVCPLTFSEMKRVYAELDESAEQVKILFVSVDPERDTLDKMTSYLGRFHQDFIGLREEGDTLQKLMDEFGAVAEKQPLDDSGLAYLVDHTASVFLINAQGELEVQYLYGTDYREIVHDLQIILGDS